MLNLDKHQRTNRMSVYQKNYPPQSNTIRVFQHIFDDLVNNTLTIEYFNLLNKAISEDFKIIFVSYGAGDDNETLIESAAHLKNTITQAQGLQILT